MYRLYAFVEKHLSPLDKGIQVAHSIVEYSNKYVNTDEYKQWANTDKTIVVLNGGSVKDIEELIKTFKENQIKYAVFQEPDMGGVVTSLCLIVDSNIYEFDTLSDYTCTLIGEESDKLSELGQEDFLKYAESKWLKLIGGSKNRLIFETIKSRHLAR